jgi:hypothetical protein
MTTILLILGTQIVGFFLIYALLKKRLTRFVETEKMGERVREELNSIMVELNRITEQNVGVIEDRIKSLAELLAKADKKIALLKREAEKHEVGSAVYRSLKERQPPEVGEKPESMRQKVLRLHGEGFSPEVIAGNLGTTIGEVELIISMKRQGRERGESIPP